jgi:small nuclear ribonucleoprotein
MENRKPEEKALVGLEKFLNTVVTVNVKDGRRFKGRLMHYDEHMNLLLEDAEEIPETGPAIKRKLILLKGGNVLDVSV